MTDVTPSVPVKMATLDSTDVRRGKFDICPLHLTLFRFKNKKKKKQDLIDIEHWLDTVIT